MKHTKARLLETILSQSNIDPGITTPQHRDYAIHALPPTAINSTIDAFIAAIKQSLAQGNTIELRGFGTFELRQRKGKTARNPKTGAAVQVDSHSVVAFKPGKELREAVRNISSPSD